MHLLVPAENTKLSDHVDTADIVIRPHLRMYN